jgi:hypothetical protein
MKHFLKFAAILAVASLLTGCLQMASVAKVKPDGSGTVEMTVMLRKDMIEQMQKMAEAFQPPDAEKKPFNIFDEAKLKKEAAEMGEGVKYVSGEKITADKWEGYKATYSFTDINKLKLNPSADGEMMGGQPDEEKKKEVITFQFTKGDTSTLVVKMPPPDPAKKPKQKENGGAEAEIVMAMMKQVMSGMKASIVIEIEGTIVKTNATHRDGNRITIMEMDLDKLMADDKAFKKLHEAEPESYEEMQKLGNTIPGLKIDENKELSVEFK